MNLSLYNVHELYKLENESGIFCGVISVTFVDQNMKIVPR